MKIPREPQQLELDFTPNPDIADGLNALDRVLCQAYRKDLKSESPQRRRKAVKGLARLPKLASTSIAALGAQPGAVPLLPQFAQGVLEQGHGPRLTLHLCQNGVTSTGERRGLSRAAI
jgi:hypothetical protein